MKFFPLACRGGEIGANKELSGVMRMSRFYVYLLRLSSSLIINPSSLLIALLSYTLNGHLGPVILSCFGKHPDVSLKSLLVFRGLLR